MGVIVEKSKDRNLIDGHLIYKQEIYAVGITTFEDVMEEILGNYDILVHL